MQSLLALLGLVIVSFASTLLFGANIHALLHPLLLILLLSVGVFMVLTAFVGCCGTCYALRDLRANHDGVITTDDYHVGKHKGTFRCFVVSVFPVPAGPSGAPFKFRWKAPTSVL